MDIDKMEAGREMDAAIAERVMGWRWNKDWNCLTPKEQSAKPDDMWTIPTIEGYQEPVKENIVGGLIYNANFTHIVLPPYSTDIAAAWLVDKPNWYWNFLETPLFLQVTLYPSKELFHNRPWDMQPIPKGIIDVKINWYDGIPKESAYALGRCRAALKDVETK